MRFANRAEEAGMKTAKRVKPVVIVFLFSFFSSLGLWYCSSLFPPLSPFPEQGQGERSSLPPSQGTQASPGTVVSIPPSPTEPPPAPDSFTTDSSPSVPQPVEGTIAPGDTLYTILRRENLDPQQIMELVEVAKPLHDLSRTIPGNTYSLLVDREGKLRFFRYQIDELDTLVVQRTAQGLEAKLETLALQTRLTRVAAVIEDTLYHAVLRAGEYPQLAFMLADVFAWDIDFSTDIRTGDFFRLLVEKKYTPDGKFVRYGPILAAEISNQGKVYRGFYFQPPHGEGDYYDEEGRSLRRQFLKSPLNYRRISSGFTYRRYHPILKRYRPHLGIDYAAPSGTPVVVVGDGIVTWAGWKGGYGRFIRVKHRGNFVTSYAHLSRYAKGIRRGVRVKQGQVIGYVGSTGLSTGPHLDFRLQHNGRFINPLTVPATTAAPVDPAYRELFKRYARKLQEVLYPSTLMSSETLPVEVIAFQQGASTVTNALRQSRCLAAKKC
ncbi:MAG: M23 family metallopeptidase [Nitrospinota bacterium]|nr:MAG: M23 family metallopeptidase [Nitrospinota bacterium]